MFDGLLQTWSSNEAQAVRSKGDAYRRYQETTSAFVPWLRRGAERRAAAPLRTRR